MNRLLYAEAAAAADRAAMDLGIPSLVLMERAALSVVHFLDHHREQYDTDCVLAVCGPGNNGGDGAAIVRILRERGLDARVLFVGSRDKCSAQMTQQLAILENIDASCVLDAAALDEVFRSFHTVMGVTNISMRGVYETTARKCGPVERMLFVGR